MSLPQAIRSMLDDIAPTVPAARITYGTRNEFGELPAITYMITDNETLTTGSSPLRKCKITISSVADTGEEAQSIAENVETHLDIGTYNSITFCAIVNMNSILQEATSSLGEETNPFICVTTADIYYEG
jgi:hypothetical protein